MDSLEKYLESVYFECLYDGVSTCRFFFADDISFIDTYQQCKNFLKDQKNYILIELTGEISGIKDWIDYINYSLKHMKYINNSEALNIKGFAEILAYLFKTNYINLHEFKSCDFNFHSLKNAIIHYLKMEDTQEPHQTLKSYLNGEYIKISKLRSHKINDVKLNLNKRNCLMFFKTCIETLLWFGVPNILYINTSKQISPKGNTFVPNKIIKDFIDLTVSNYFPKSLAIFIINGNFNDFSTPNDALKTRLDSCIRVLGKPFPSISPMVEFYKG
jgi:hypothetical protein